MRKPSISIRCVTGRLALHAPQSTFPRTAWTGASAPSLASTSGLPTSPAWMMGSQPASAASASARSRPWVYRPNGSHHARPDYKRSRVRREPRAIGSATDKLPSKHPAAIPGWGSQSAEERLGHPATAQPFSAVGLVVVLLANGFTPECLFFRDAPLA